MDLRGARACVCIYKLATLVELQIGLETSRGRVGQQLCVFLFEIIVCVNQHRLRVPLCVHTNGCDL